MSDKGLVGSTIKGRYHLVRAIGDGGVGSVFKAADQLLRRFVAIKLLHSTTARKPEAVQRFLQEARTAASIGHPNVTDVLDFGEEGSRPFLVMEYLRGRSLSHAIAHDGQFSVMRACRIATHGLAGLAAAHGRGVLHRDLKPANLMLIAQFGDPDFVKVCDFGFATLLGAKAASAQSLTPARTLVGTPAYAAPERLRGDNRADPRIDVYSMGVVLYEMLAGRRPFDAPTFRELSRKIRQDPPPPLRFLRPDMPEPLEQVVLRALAKDRDDRWPSVESFADALVPFGGKQVAHQDQPSDSFTMDLLRLRARETAHNQERRKHPTGDYVVRGKSAAGTAAAAAAAAAAAPTKTRPSLSDTNLREPSGSLDIEVSIDTAPGIGEDAVRERRTDRAPPMAMTPASTELIEAADPFARDTNVDLGPPSAARGFEGAGVLAVLRYVGERFGQLALRDLLAYLPEASARDLFARGVSADDCVPYTTMCSVLERIDNIMGRDDLHLVVECGRQIAMPMLDRISASKRMLPPDVLINELPSFARRLLPGVSFAVTRGGRGYAHLALDEKGESSLVGCVCILGIIEQALDHAGAEEVEVTMTSCQALGDEDTLFELTWLS